MELIKSTILTACIMAMISAAVLAVAPENRKRELRLVCTLVLISCTAAGLLGSEQKLPQREISSTSQFEFDYENMLINTTRRNLEERLAEKLSQAGIAAKKISIETEFDEYDYISAGRVTVIADDLSDESRQTALEIIKEIVGENAEVVISGSVDETNVLR